MRCLSFTLIGAFVTTSLLAQQADSRVAERTSGHSSADADTLIQQILVAKEPYEVKYESLFEKIGTEGVWNLLMYPSDSIAIQAAWEVVALSIPERTEDKVVRPQRTKLKWFVRFLERRGRVKAPKWWVESLLDSRAAGGRYISPGTPNEQPYHKAGLDLISSPPDTTLTKDGGRILVHVGRESVPIPEDLLTKSDAGNFNCYVSVLITPSRCYIAVHDDVGYPYDLACIDRTSAKVLWKSKAWGTWWGGVSGRQRQMFVTVTEQDNRVVVFGSGDTGINAEAFRSDNGANLFRFSSTLSNRY